jgi:hypothetical protein
VRGSPECSASSWTDYSAGCRDERAGSLVDPLCATPGLRVIHASPMRQRPASSQSKTFDCGDRVSSNQEAQSYRTCVNYGGSGRSSGTGSLARHLISLRAANLAVSQLTPRASPVWTWNRATSEGGIR